MLNSSIVSRSKKVLLENYGREPIAMVKGEGSFIYDEQGKKYIDLFVGFGAGGLVGHSNKEVLDAVSKQASTLLAHGNLFSSEPQVSLAEKLLEYSFQEGKVFFCHSGAEADETALKLCRKATDESKNKLICFDGCFHGRTMGGLSLCPEVFQKGFHPVLEGIVRIPFNCKESFDAVFDESVAGVFVEPIQGEGGINVPDKEFLQHIQRRCNESGALMVCDEVWTAPARTGKWFAYQHFDIEPDVITVAKALGGGLPVAACIIKDKWTHALGPGSHGCTMGGNPICTIAGVAALNYVQKHNLVELSAERGEEIKTTLKTSLKDALVDVRGKGFMIGIQLREDIKAKEVVDACRENEEERVILCTAKNNVVRLAPALNIEQEVLQRGLKVLIDTIQDKTP